MERLHGADRHCRAALASHTFKQLLPFALLAHVATKPFNAGHLAMLEELILAVARGASLSPEQAKLAVAAVLRFFTARLPSSLVGELHARLGSGRSPPSAT